jgi:hypothetical protein
VPGTINERAINTPKACKGFMVENGLPADSLAAWERVPRPIVPRSPHATEGVLRSAGHKSEIGAFLRCLRPINSQVDWFHRRNASRTQKTHRHALHHRLTHPAHFRRIRILPAAKNQLPDTLAFQSHLRGFLDRRFGKGGATQILQYPAPAKLTADKGGPLKIFKGPLDDKGNPTDAAPSLVELPASSSILLLGWMENDKPVFLAVPDAFDTAKSEDWLVVNTSKTALTVQIGEKAKPLPVGANSQQIVRSTVPLGEGAAVLVSAKQADASWKNVYSSYLPTFAGSRGLLVVVQKGERLNVNYISDKISAK